MMAEERFDLAVIGAGAGGSTAASEAIGRGAKVALIEEWLVGGTCLNVGCDPTKTLVRSAEIVHLARTAARFGVTIPEVKVDWPAVRRRVDTVIDAIRGGDGDKNVRASGIALFKEHGRLLGEGRIAAGDQVIVAEKIIIATGARSTIPPIPGLNEAGFITNIEAVALDALPKSLAIIGGGTIGVEFAQIFARFGVNVTVVGSRELLLPREDEDLSRELRAILEREGIRIETGVRLSEVTVVNGVKTLRGLRGDAEVVVEAEEILVAAGRTPAVDDLGLEAAGVAFSKRGIVVDEHLRTTAENIWALGDAVGGFPFTHVADYQARIAEHNAMSGEPPRRADYRATPWVTFTDPELARVGLTEAEARAVSDDVHIATVRMKDMTRAMTSDETDGLIKLITERSNGMILGAHILAARGGELLPQIVLAMRNGLPAGAIADAIHAYPTMSEAVFWAAFNAVQPEPLIEMRAGQIVAEQ
jgi:pyruvate/2-oxoglutarate dehydrogenase complex dihydrolipoamide dehydrogenase (E3) component